MRGRNPSPRLAAAALACLALAACGGGEDVVGGGLDRSDPEAVTEAFVKSFWSCGPTGARLRAKLTQPGTKAVDSYTIQAKVEELPGGCSPTTPPVVRTATISQEADRAVVSIYGGDCDGEEMVVLRIGSDYYYATETDDRPNGLPDVVGCT